jgi:hypothetical protein
MLRKVEVGQPYNPAVTEWPETATFWYREYGYELVLFWDTPEENEIRALTENPFEVGLFLNESLIFLVYRIKGGCEWSEAGYSYHMIPKEERLLPEVSKTNDAPDRRFQVVLVDSKTGIVQGVRKLKLGLEFASLIYRTIHTQAKMEWNETEFNRALERTYELCPNTLAMLQGCVVREIAEDR